MDRKDCMYNFLSICKIWQTLEDILTEGKNFYFLLNSSFALECCLGKPKSVQICIVCNVHGKDIYFDIF